MASAERDAAIAQKLLDEGLIDEAGPGLEWAPGKLSTDLFRRAVKLGLRSQSPIPSYVWELDNLVSLGIDGSPDTQISADICNLRQLNHLVLILGQLEVVPGEIGQLPLKRLDLSGNALQVVPARLGNLPESTEVDLRGNPLVEPFASLYSEGGWPALRNYLRSLDSGTGETPAYEAKVLLVGEGGVGKSSLLAALRDEPFRENRDTTHGIEIKPLALDHPAADISESLFLNFWDFGGQEVYRITHQFFFSTQAVYLLVWKPREGAEENSIAGWLHRIRIRVGQNARVLLVATHCDERHPELDYPTLRAEFGDMLAGQFSIDSNSGTGIPELKTAITRIAGELPHSCVPFNPQWIEARRAIMALNVPHMSREDFVREASHFGLDGHDALSLLRILHTLGHVVHWDVKGLADFVVVKPEWLTKAIGFVLADRTTRESAGVLDHHRLAEIWRDHGREKEPRYDAEHFPFFLSLMEQYDVSARTEGADQSLVAQLVPYERPTICWTNDESAALPTMALSCILPHEPPGLVAWTTVRNHHWSTGTHWRRGVFLRHDDGHEALLELVDRLGAKEFIITVRGRHPSHLVSLIRDGIERLIDERWPWLARPERKYTFEVPCHNARCQGRFPLEFLLRVVEDETVRCQVCAKKCDVVKLLYGHTISRQPLRDQLDALIGGQAVMLKELASAKEERQLYAAQAAELTRRVLRTFLSDANRGPRLFSLEPADYSKWNPKRISKTRYRLRLWCEHPGHEHALPDASWEFERPKQWLQRIAPYATLVAQCLQVAVPIAAAAAGLPIVGIPKELKSELDFVKSLTTLLPEVEAAPVEMGSLMGDTMISSAEGAGLRALHDLLAELNWKPGQFGLGRVTSKSSGDILWVCSEHRPEYEPGLPVLPASPEAVTPADQGPPPRGQKLPRKPSRAKKPPRRGGRP